MSWAIENPDTDTVVSAIGYAWLLRERDKLDVQPARAGQLNPQTSFALRTFEIEPPAGPGRCFAALWQRGAGHRAAHARPADSGGLGAHRRKQGASRRSWMQDRKPVGLVTGASVFHFLSAHAADQLARSPDALGQIPFGQVLATPCGQASEPDVPGYEANARIKDSLARILRDERDTFWVVDDNGRYAGVCWKSDLLHPPRLRLILIDHNETTQAISGLEEAELLEVLDHHRLANPPTHMPIAFHVDPVGSSSTLVAERAMRSGLAVPRPIAGALLSGLLSDTLVLKSPTTTDRDRVAAVQLAAWAFAGQGDPYKAMLDYGWQLLQAGAGLQSPDDGLYRFGRLQRVRGGRPALWHGAGRSDRHARDRSAAGRSARGAVRDGKEPQPELCRVDGDRHRGRDEPPGDVRRLALSRRIAVCSPRGWNVRDAGGRVAQEAIASDDSERVASVRRSSIHPTNICPQCSMRVQ